MDALIHFHILWFLPRYDNEDEADALALQSTLYSEIKSRWCINLGSRRVPKYVPLFQFRSSFRNGKLYSNYDTHYVRPALGSDGVSSVAFYVCKYMLKGSNKEQRLQQALRLNLQPAEYDVAWSVVKSRTLRSTHFGFGFDFNRDSIVKHLTECVQISKNSSKFPMFFSPNSSKSFPLCPYYRMSPDVFTMKDWLDFHLDDDSVIVDCDKTISERKIGSSRLEKVQMMVELHDLSLDLL